MKKTLTEAFSDWASSSRGDLSRISDSYPELDYNDLTRKLGIVEAGRTDGADNVPPSNSEIPSSIESQIDNEIADAAARYARAYQDQANAYRDRYQQRTSFWEIDLVENQEKELVDEVVAHAKSLSGPVVAQQKILVAKAKQLLMFRKSNNLMDRLPSINNVWRWAVLIMLVALAEFALTFVLMREGIAPQQLIIIALVFVTVNSIIPLVAFAPLIKNAFWSAGNYLLRAVGILAFIFSIIFAFGINLLVAHYRYAVSNESFQTQSSFFSQSTEPVSSTASLAWESFTTDIFYLPDPNIWLVIIVNIFFFLSALKEGIYQKDYYPKYGNTYTEFEEAEDSYNDLLNSSNDSLLEIRSKGIEKIEKFRNALKLSFSTAPTLIQKAHENYDFYRTRVEDLKVAREYLIKLYRQENLRTRTTDSPKYFSTIADSKIKPMPEIVIEEKEPDIDLILNKLENYVDNVNSEFDTIIEKIQGSDEVLQEINPLEIT